MTRHTRHTYRRWTGVRYIDPHQLTLPLQWSREEVRASLTVIRGGAAPEPTEMRVAARKARAA